MDLGEVADELFGEKADAAPVVEDRLAAIQAQSQQAIELVAGEILGGLAAGGDAVRVERLVPVGIVVEFGALGRRISFFHGFH